MDARLGSCVARVALGATVVVSFAAAATRPALGQSLQVRAVALSADTVSIGDRFDLRLSVVLTDDLVAFLPDSLEGSGFEPFAPVEWSEVTVPGGSTLLSVTYPLVAMDLGSVAVPEFAVFAGSRSEGEAARLAVAGRPVGSWEAFRRAPAALPSARLASVPEQRVWVQTVLALDGITERIAPRPLADVWGGSRQWASSMLVAVFGLALAAIVAASVRAWRQSARIRSEVVGGLDPRSRALMALDGLLARGLHLDGRVKDFFTESSTIVRAYVEDLDPRWDRAWTSTELMSALAGRGEAPGLEGLREEMARAEAVKFGGCRPDSATAEAHWRTVRDWIDVAPTPAGTPAEAASAGVTVAEHRP
jgi:hypothetical protein